MRLNLIKLLPVIIGFFMFSCNATNNDELVKTINELKDSQAVVLKKMNSLEKAMNNLALASKSPPSNNKQQPPKADPNKVYNVPVGDSFSKGPKDAAVTIIEWSDFQ